jgi:hypothetical protein
MPVLVCHDEVVIECGSEKAAYAKAWLKKTMIEGMHTVLDSTDEGQLPVGVEARVATSRGERG